jgi:hypothetical protein
MHNETGPKTPNLEGADALIEWFGRWPSFHDAEIISLELRRASSSFMRIHTWNLTGAIKPDGFYVLDKHVIVAFEMVDISDLELVQFSKQNVISGLGLEPIENHPDGATIKITLGCCYGLCGQISCRKLRLKFAPGEPSSNE